MRVALLSDIHSNLPALLAVLRHLGREPGEVECSCGGEVEVDRLWCLGDTVGYNAQPAECLELVREHCAIVLLGNHDWAALTGDTRIFNPHAAAGVDHSRKSLAESDLAFLATLAPLLHLSGRGVPGAGAASDRPGARPAGALLCHGSPEDPLWEYLDVPTARRFLGRRDLPPLVAFGHTHVPFVLEDEDGALLLNAGSVGQPRDGDPRAAFFTVDLETGDPVLHRVEYPVEEAAAAIEAAGLPTVLAERLHLGR